MPDKRVPRGSKLETPGGEGTDYPLNDGGVPDYREEKKEEQRRLREIEEEQNKKHDINAPKRLDSNTGVGGFGVKPMTDVLSNSRRYATVSHPEKFITLSYADVLEFVSGDSVLVELMDYLRNNEENTYNPPTREEFGHMLKCAIRRESGKIDTEDIPSEKSRAAGRVLSSPTGKKEYADPQNMAFPIDNAPRTRTAHAYIHKYWNSPSKKGVTATYGRDDFIRAHKKIVSAMKKNGVEHNHLDSLDDASGFKKDSSIGNKGDESCKADKGAEVKESSGKFFQFYEGQSVVSFARSRMREKGTIKKIDGAVATVQWESSGLDVPELLAGLIPSF